MKVALCALVFMAALHAGSTLRCHHCPETSPCTPNHTLACLGTCVTTWHSSTPDDVSRYCSRDHHRSGCFYTERNDGLEHICYCNTRLCNTACKVTVHLALPAVLLAGLLLLQHWSLYRQCC
nr:uncharacterized protein LOC123754240 [Procambarus clarkii]